MWGGCLGRAARVSAKNQCHLTLFVYRIYVSVSSYSPRTGRSRTPGYRTLHTLLTNNNRSPYHLRVFGTLQTRQAKLILNRAVSPQQRLPSSQRRRRRIVYHSDREHTDNRGLEETTRYSMVGKWEMVRIRGVDDGKKNFTKVRFRIR